MNSRITKGLSVTLLITLIIMVAHVSSSILNYISNAKGYLFFGIPIVFFTGACIIAILIDFITKIIKR